MMKNYFMLISLLFCTPALAVTTQEAASKETVRETLPIQNGVTALILSEDGKTLWVGTVNGLEQRDALTGRLIRVLSSIDRKSGSFALGSITALATDGEGGVWVGTNNVLLHLSHEGVWIDEPLSYKQELNITSLVGEKNSLWIGTNYGLGHLTSSNGLTFFSKLNSILPNEFVFSLASDGQGGVWVATYDTALIHFTSQHEQTITTPDPSLDLKGGQANLTSDGKGGIWGIWGRNYYCCPYPLVHVDAEGKWNVEKEGGSHPLINDGGNGVWLGYNDWSEGHHSSGLVGFDNQMKAVFRFKNPQALSFSALAHDGRGGLWMGTGGGSLVHLTFQEKYELLPLGQSHDSLFKGGASVNGHPYQQQTVLTTADTVEVKGSITVAPQHIGYVADLVVYVSYQLTPSAKEVGFLMLDTAGHVRLWRKDQEELVAFQEQVILPIEQPVRIYKGPLSSPGLHKVFFGYRLPDGTVVITPQSIDMTMNSELPLLGQTQAMDPAGHAITTMSELRGGISINGQDYKKQVDVTLHDLLIVDVRGEIFVDPSHIGLQADIFAYVEAIIPPSQESVWVMIDEQFNILPWDRDPAHLVGFKNHKFLLPREQVIVYTGLFNYLGTRRLHLGYRLEEGTMITSGEGIDITIN